jgi:hypothetical protein
VHVEFELHAGNDVRYAAVKLEGETVIEGGRGIEKRYTLRSRSIVCLRLRGIGATFQQCDAVASQGCTDEQVRRQVVLHADQRPDLNGGPGTARVNQHRRQIRVGGDAITDDFVSRNLGLDEREAAPQPPAS